jgi:ABC-2 type transport system ATP-binding protein
MSVIVAENLGKRYGHRVGLENLSLSVPEGVVFGFLGPNGAGKSTTIRLLLGFMRPSEGKASIFGLDCWRESARIKEEVGYVPGDLRLYPWMTGREGLKIVGMIRRRDLAKPGAAMAERLRLDLDVPVRQMSRGTRQKLGLVLALAPRPKLLALDEPTSALDPLTQADLMDHLRERSREGATVFFSSHIISEVESLCDRVAILRGGRLVVDDSLKNLRERATRHAILRWKTEDAAQKTKTPAFLGEVARRGREWRCDVAGASMELIQWAAGQPLEDLSIGPPDLETLFHRYYEREKLDAEPAESPAPEPARVSKEQEGISRKDAKNAKKKERKKRKGISGWGLGVGRTQARWRSEQ